MAISQRFRIKKNGEACSQCVCRYPELIENYNLMMKDTTNTIWQCHHRLETHFSDGTERPKNAQLSRAELIALGMYYDRPPEELIFLTVKDHHCLHKKGNHRSEETRKRISKSRKGQRGPWKGKQHSEETKRKMVESYSRKVKVQCVETGQMFESIKVAMKYIGAKGNYGIRQACKDSKYTSGGYHWRYI